LIDGKISSKAGILTKLIKKGCMTEVAVIGAGAWGTSISNLLGNNGHQVRLWCFEESTVNDINQYHENKSFLSGIKLSKNIIATNDFSDLKTAKAIFSVIPAQFTKDTLSPAKEIFSQNIPIVICSKGIENKSQRLLSEILQEIFPENNIAVMSGPNFADEVAIGKEAITTVACKNPEVAKLLSSLLENNKFSVSLCDDIIGAQLGGSIKNVIAIALGIATGLELSESSKAALLTIGIKEINSLSHSLGGNIKTATEPCIIGDLILTCSSLKSRNMSLGYEIGQGKSLNDLMSNRTTIAEGVATTKAAKELADKLNLKPRVINMMYDILYKNTKVSKEILTKFN